MTKRRRVEPGSSDLKEKLSKLLDDKDKDCELRPYKRKFENGIFKTIWLREDDERSHSECFGYIFCDHEACKRKKNFEKVIKNISF